MKNLTEVIDLSKGQDCTAYIQETTITFLSTENNTDL